MIINVRASSSVDFGNYLTSRDKKAFTIIEGDPKRIDALASSLLQEKKNRKTTHYSFVLSFKEDSLTKDDLFNYYMQFKGHMFKNYSSDELEILSVIHWDDVKPHIHCTVLNASQLDDSRDLRLYRGYVDFKRVESVQEKINYENNLISPFDNYNLLSLTKEQKTRDWLVKKGKNHYGVFDDNFFRIVEQSIKNAKDFNSFISLVEKEFGSTIIHAATKFKKDEFSVNKILNEYVLVLKDRFLPTGQNYIYSSKLFDRRWFEKNLFKIQDSLSRVRLENIKFSADKKSLKEYDRLLKETTQKHAEHILSRRVGKEYVEANIDKVLNDNLELFNNGSLNNLEKDICESIVERLLENCDAGRLEKFLLRFPYPFDLKKDFVRFKKNNGETFDIYNQDFLLHLKQKGVSSRNGRANIINEKKSIKIENFEELLKNLQSNGNKAKFRSLLLSFIEQERIKNLQELELLLKKLGLKIKKSGSDFKRGDYITLMNESGSVSVYDVFLASIVKNKVFLQETAYISKRDHEIENGILNNDISFYLKSVYSDIVEEVESESIKCVANFKLYQSDYVGSIIEENGFIYMKSYADYTKLYKNSYEQIVDNKAGGLLIEKSLNKNMTGENIADFYHQKGIADVYIDDRNFDSEIKAGIIHRVQEMNYDICLWDRNPSYLDGTSLLFKNDGSRSVSNKDVKTAKDFSIGTNIDSKKEAGGLNGVSSRNGNDKASTLEISKQESRVPQEEYLKN